MSDEEDMLAALAEVIPTAMRATPKAPDLSTDEGGDLADQLAAMGAKQEVSDPDLVKPWMRFHTMELVQTIDRVKEVVDGAIAFGRCSLDLETTGLDTRIDYDTNGAPHTKAKVVGYCIGYNGAGHYIPVRHKFDTVMGEDNPNVSPSQVGLEITRLVRASQPKLTPEGLEQDPLASPLIEEPGKVKILFWHAKFDQEMLYPVTGLDFWHPDSFEDGMLMFYCVYSDDMSYELKIKAKQFLRVKDPKTGQVYPYEMIKYDKLFPKGTPKEERRIQKLYPRPDSDVTRYGCSDAICTELLCTLPWLVEKLEKTNRGVYRLEKMTTQAVRIMERSRVLIDKQAVKSVRDEAEQALKECEDQIKAIADSIGFKDFNPGSTEQLAVLLFDKKWLNLNPKPEKTPEGQYKTDAKTLEKLMEIPGAPAIIKLSLTYRQIQKVLGTYLDKMVTNVDERDRLRFDFKQHGAATGRFSAPQEQKEERAFGREGYSGIPIQGIPARDNPSKPKVAGSLRKTFIAHAGYCIVKVDYAGQELRVVTNISNEPVWEKEFLEGTGDLHTITAQAFYPGLQKGDPDFKLKRNSGKMANFSLIYGGGVQAIMRATGCDKVEAARKLGNFHESVPKFAKWVKKQHASVKQNLGVRTAFGRFIAIPEADVKVGDVKKDFWGNPILKDGQEQRYIEKEVRIKRASSERKSTNFPIQGSGADICKISLVKCTKEFIKRGWLRNGGDDSVRLLMTVHDEIVFEIRLDRLMDAVPLICELMESPDKMPKPSWKVPLVVEPLVDLSWDANVDWHLLIRGTTDKGAPYAAPDWLAPYLDLDRMRKDEAARLERKGQAPAPAPTASPSPPPAKPVASPTATPAPSETFTALEPTAAVAPPPLKSEEPPRAPLPPIGSVAVFTLDEKFMTPDSVWMVADIQLASHPVKVAAREGRPVAEIPRCNLRMVTVDGDLLIDPAFNDSGLFDIDPETFSRKMRQHNFPHNFRIDPK